MADFRIVFRCGGCGGSSEVRMCGVSREYATTFAQLTDGTSPMYLASPVPDPNSIIGKCAQCKSQLSSEVLDV